jgi:hypothetical protein
MGSPSVFFLKCTFTVTPIFKSHKLFYDKKNSWIQMNVVITGNFFKRKISNCSKSNLYVRLFYLFSQILPQQILGREQGQPDQVHPGGPQGPQGAGHWCTWHSGCGCRHCGSQSRRRAPRQKCPVVFAWRILEDSSACYLQVRIFTKLKSIVFAL